MQYQGSYRRLLDSDAEQELPVLQAHLTPPAGFFGRRGQRHVHKSIPIPMILV